MDKYRFECLYCGTNWYMLDLQLKNLEYIICPVCDDTNIKQHKNLDRYDVFGYNNIVKQDAYIKRNK